MSTSSTTTSAAAAPPSTSIESALSTKLKAKYDKHMQRSRTEALEKYHKQAALKYYDISRQVPHPSNSDYEKFPPQDEIWDALLHDWGPAASMKAAFILPPDTATTAVLRTISASASASAEDADLAFDVRNCVVLWTPLAHALEDGAFALIPIPTTDDGAPTEYKTVLLDASLPRTAAVKYYPSVTWGALDGAVLRFRNGRRPRREHAWLNVASRVVAGRALGWDGYARGAEAAWVVAPAGWIRGSVVREVARVVGDGRVLEVLGEGAVDDDDDDQDAPDRPSKAEVKKAAKDWIAGSVARQVFERVPEKAEDDSDEEESDFELF